MSEIDVSGWSCDERNRKACRNGHGCHCREIAVLRGALAAQRETGAHVQADSVDDLGAWLHDYDYGEDHEPNANCVEEYRAMARAILAKYDVRRRP
jgi:hypothetical protein